MRSLHKKKRKWLKVTGIVLLVLLVAGGVYGFTVYQSFNKALETIHQPIERKQSEQRDIPLELEEKEPFSILILGVDERDGDSGRSDTMIVLAVNPKANSIKMLSIPRDTRTEIIGKGIDDKINHAYAFGKVPMAMDTVEAFLDIPIDYYIKINLEGFKEIVDAVGGVTVNNDLDFTETGVHFPKGEIHLNGEKALIFSRMRYQDTRGDFGRQLRQRQVIQAIIKQGSSISSLTKLTDIFTALSNNVSTNLSFEQMVDIQNNYKGVEKTIQQMAIKSSGTRIDRIIYEIVSPEEKLRVQNELKTQLGLTSEPNMQS
jgi:polyisoprenyl-teichoic acid--peptidoglycan teichoic acid transferase